MEDEVVKVVNRRKREKRKNSVKTSFDGSFG